MIFPIHAMESDTLGAAARAQQAQQDVRALEAAYQEFLASNRHERLVAAIRIDISSIQQALARSLASGRRAVG